jgi:uncharacterized protein
MSLEKSLQIEYGSTIRADRFENNQKIDYLNESMINFISKQKIAFIATSDKNGNCDNSIRTGPDGFLKVINSKTIYYPEYRGNGVYASLGNILENPHIGILIIDFFESTIGLHINGKAEILNSTSEVEDALAERWVKITVEEAYIHCSKHIPKLQILNKPIHWNTDDTALKGGDYFGTAAEKYNKAIKQMGESANVE